MNKPILFRWMKTFDVDLLDVHKLAEQAGISAFRQRHALRRTDIFDGSVHLGQADTMATVTLGVRPAVGALMSVRIPADTPHEAIADLSYAADAWFRKYWIAFQN